MTATLMRKVATLLRAHFAPSLGAAVVVLLAAALLVADARVAALGLAGLLLAVTAAVLILYRRLVAAQAFDARFLKAIDSIDQGFGMFDAEQRLVLCNSRYREIYRRNGTDTNSRMAEIGMTLQELIALRIENGLYAVPPGQSTESYIEERIKAIHAARNQVLRTGDGRWFAIDLSPAPDGGWVTLWTDITQIKRAEEERRLLEIQLHNAQKLEAMGTLAAGSSSCNAAPSARARSPRRCLPSAARRSSRPAPSISPPCCARRWSCCARACRRPSGWRRASRRCRRSSPMPASSAR